MISEHHFLKMNSERIMYQRIFSNGDIIPLNLTKNISMADTILDITSLKGKQLTVWGEYNFYKQS